MREPSPRVIRDPLWPADGARAPVARTGRTRIVAPDPSGVDPPGTKPYEDTGDRGGRASPSRGRAPGLRRQDDAHILLRVPGHRARADRRLRAAAPRRRAGPGAPGPPARGAPLGADHPPAGGALRPRRVRGWLRPAVVDRLLVRRATRAPARLARLGLLRGAAPDRALLPGRGTPRPAAWPHPDDGRHAPCLERPADRGGTGAVGAGRDRVAAGAPAPLPDRCADAAGLRDVGRGGPGAGSGREHH